MKKSFRSFYPDCDVTEKNINNDDILVCLDANVLLNIYRYSKETRNELLSSFSDKNIFVPFNAALEFNYNKQSVKSSVIKQKDNMNSRIEEAKKVFLKNLQNDIENSKQLKCTKSNEILKEVLDNFNKDFETFIKNNLEEKLNIYNSLPSYDDTSLSNQLAQLLDSKIGQPYNDSDMKKTLNEAAIRFKNNIPPGFEDSSKSEISCYFIKDELVFYEKKFGDYIVWSQIIDYARNRKDISKVLFVTDDSKNDWIYRIKGETIGIRAELRNEFYEKTNKYIKIINSNTYLQYINKSQNQFITIDNNHVPFIYRESNKQIAINNYIVNDIMSKAKLALNESKYILLDNEVKYSEYGVYNEKEIIELYETFKNYQNLLSSKIRSITNLDIQKESEEIINELIIAQDYIQRKFNIDYSYNEFLNNRDSRRYIND